MARSFNGSTDRIDFANPFDFQGQPLTISVWVNPQTYGNTGYATTIHPSGDTTYGHGLRFNTSNSYGFFRGSNGGNDKYRAGTTSWLINTWYSFIVTDPGTTFGDYTEINIYRNGTNDNGSGQNGTVAEKATGGSLSNGGRIYADDRNISAYLAEIAWWNRVLSADEISALAAGYSPLFFPNGLKSYVPLIRPALDRLTGSSGTLDGTSVVDHPPVIYPAPPPQLHIEYTAGGATLTVADASVTTQVDAPSLTQVHNIIVADASVTTQSDAPSLTQLHNLTVSDAFVTTQVDNVVVVQAHVLTVNDANVTTQSDNIDLTQVHNIIVQNAFSTTQSDNVVLVQVHNLTVADAFVTTQIDAVVVDTGALTLVVQDASVDTQVDILALTQVHNISVNDAFVTTQVDAPVLVQLHILGVDDASVIVQVDAITGMTQEHNLQVGDAFVLTQADVLSLTQVHNLSVNDAFVLPVVDTTTVGAAAIAASVYLSLFDRDKSWSLIDRNLTVKLYDRDKNWSLEDI